MMTKIILVLLIILSSGCAVTGGEKDGEFGIFGWGGERYTEEYDPATGNLIKKEIVKREPVMVPDLIRER